MYVLTVAFALGSSGSHRFVSSSRSMVAKLTIDSPIKRSRRIRSQP